MLTIGGVTVWRGKIYAAPFILIKIVYIGQTQTALSKRVQYHIKSIPLTDKNGHGLYLERFAEKSIFTLCQAATSQAGDEVRTTYSYL